MNLKQGHTTHARQSIGFLLRHFTKDSFLRDFQHIWGILLMMGEVIDVLTSVNSDTFMRFVMGTIR